MDNISTSSANSSETPRGKGDTVRTASTSREYGAKNLLVLEGLEAVRKRPAMYIGSTDTRGLMHCLWEIFDNGVDEALAGYGRRITVTLEKAGSILVTDEGRGIPVDVEPRTGLSGLEVVYTKLHAGGKFGGGAYNVSGGAWRRCFGRQCRLSALGCGGGSQVHGVGDELSPWRSWGL